MREEKRMGVTMNAVISDGNFAFEGRVENISRSGFKMADIPAKFNAESSECTAVISNKTRNYKVAIRPIWSTEEGIYKVVGFDILSPPAAWLAFVDELNPEIREEDQQEREKTGVRMILPGD
ncbi:MAG: hypothetical protein RI601_03590 [Desulfurivibrionaceae bacterium]|nr:hypothetical protein [Desulfurivibrionaceae bacterium]